MSCSKQQTFKYLGDREPSHLHYIDDLDTKLYIICSKYEALHLYDDLKGTLIQEIGINNYYSTMQRRMSIISYTNDIGTCQFQPATYKWLSNKYGINTNIINIQDSVISLKDSVNASLEAMYKQKVKKLRRQRNTFAGATLLEFLVILGLISKI